MITTTRRIRLYEPDFAADPHAAYRAMRAEAGPLVPVDLAPGVPATLVIGYEEARRVLADPLRFPADPRRWQATIPPDSPVLGMMGYRPNAIRTDGAAHARYRGAILAGLDAVDQHDLRAYVEDVAAQTIAGFEPDGKADLLAQYAMPLVFRSLSWLLGCPDDIGNRLMAAMLKVFEAVGEDANDANEAMTEVVFELISLRREHPGPDLTSTFITHEAQLDDLELCHQVLLIYAAAIEPLPNLIVNTLQTMLTDPDLSGDLHAGDASVREALDAVLYRDPPLANFTIKYPPRPVDVGGFLLPADQPVVISMAACNNDPALGDVRPMNNRAHMAWSAGAHRCPAATHAYLIAETAILQILDALPELDLEGRGEDLVWRPGPFHRSLASLPVIFPVS